jgi:hypothetical protein
MSKTIIGVTVGTPTSPSRIAEDIRPVSYEKQTLTGEQKAQARDNIGAPSAEEVTALQSKFVGEKICLEDGKNSGDYYVVGVTKGKMEIAQYTPVTGVYGASKTLLTNEDEKRILEAVNTDEDSLPSAFTNERKKVISQAQSSPADFRFVAFADPHSADWKKYEKYSDLLSSGCIDAIVGLGDYQVYSSSISRGDTIKQYTEMLTHAGRTPNCFYAIGNHDVAYKNANGAVPNQDEILTKKELYDCLSRHLNGVAHFNEADPYGGYYYVDYEASKIRLIILNTSDIYEPDGSLRHKYKESVMMQQPQITWLTETALDFTGKTKPADWSVLVCFHANFEEKTKESDQMLSTILSAVKNGTKLERSWDFKLTLDNPETTGAKNLLALNGVQDEYTNVGVTITHDNGVFTANGTSNGAYSFEIVPRGGDGFVADADYGTLTAGTEYTLSLNHTSGTTNSFPLFVYIRVKNADDGVETAYETDRQGGAVTFTPDKDCTLVRFAISTNPNQIYTNFVCEPKLTAAGDASGGNESEIVTTISVNKDFSQQGAVDVIGAFYGHDHKNNTLTANGIPFVEFISDNNELDDYYVASLERSINLLPISLAEEEYSKKGVTITHSNGVFTANGTSSEPYSFEIISSGTEHVELTADVTYTLSLNHISGSCSGLPLCVFTTTRTADGTETPHNILNNGTSIEFTPKENCKLIRFAINVPAANQSYTDFVCKPTLIGEKTIGLNEGKYCFSNTNGVKMGFTVGADKPTGAVLGYNNYFAQGNTRAVLRLQDSSGTTVGMYYATAGEYEDGMTEITGFVQERTPNTAKTESCSVVSIDKDSRTIKIVPYGTGFYREINY